ncbi:hypothetical protein AMECASPLE_011998 [Ameca splendens]|uniref:G-protein coupled receptors family 1 profile domain-containing protein n=1 Tax=Ameca splendens TaxID=208324 RepID=A0ABV0YZ72_9TELE
MKRILGSCSDELTGPAVVYAGADAAMDPETQDPGAHHPSSRGLTEPGCPGPSKQPPGVNRHTPKHPAPNTKNHKFTSGQRHQPPVSGCGEEEICPTYITLGLFHYVFVGSLRYNSTLYPRPCLGCRCSCSVCDLYSSKGWCRFLMGVWVWLRSVNVWSTFFLSAFHLHTLRRVAPTIGNLQGPWSTYRTLLLTLGIIWIFNLFYSIPAYIFSTNGDENTTETLMLVSSTTRPLLGCVWNFPSNYSGLAFATTSMVIHEIFPIILMVVTNITSLYTLFNHGRSRSSAQDTPVIKRVPAERRAAKVILALVMLFTISWGTSIISVNYFNYNRGSSAEFLLVITRYANTIFIVMSPVVLAIGHRRLRSCMKSSVSG